MRSQRQDYFRQKQKALWWCYTPWFIVLIAAFAAPERQSKQTHPQKIRDCCRCTPKKAPRSSVVVVVVRWPSSSSQQHRANEVQQHQLPATLVLVLVPLRPRKLAQHQPTDRNLSNNTPHTHSRPGHGSGDTRVYFVVGLTGPRTSSNALGDSSDNGGIVDVKGWCTRRRPGLRLADAPACGGRDLIIVRCS